MKGISFGSYHSYDNFGLILSSKEIGSPEPKIITIDVEGSDGVLDFTEFAGETKFKNRKLTFHFSKPQVLSEFMQLLSEVHNALHGQKMQIILDEEPGFYYVGRITVNEFKADANIGLITIECDCDPWKYKIDETVVSNAISGSGTVTLQNQRRSVVPSVRATAAMTFSFNGSTYAISANVDTIFPSLELKEGSNTISVTGTGTITFTYQEGGL